MWCTPEKGSPALNRILAMCCDYLDAMIIQEIFDARVEFMNSIAQL